MSELDKWNKRQTAISARLESMKVNPKVIELFEDYYEDKISYDFFEAELARLIQEQMDAAGNK